MKKTGINKDGWEVKKLGEVCTGKGEYGSGSSAIAFDKSKPRYIRITDIKENGELNDEKVSPSGSDFDEYELSEGDILFARSGATVGKTYIHSEKNGYCIYAGYLIRFVVDRKVMLPKFLFHYTRSAFYNDWIKSQQRVVAQPNINAKQYGDLPIIVPPLPAQSAIVAELDSLHRLKGLQEQQLEEYDKLAQSIFYSMFGDPIENEKGWKAKKLENVCEIRSGKNQKKVENPKGKYPIMGSGGIMGYADNFICPEGTVILGRKGTINKPFVVEEKVWIVDTAFGLVSDEFLLHYLYLYYFCKSFNFLKLNVAVTIPSLRKIDLNKIDIPIPPLTLQNQFAERIEKIETQKELVKQSIAQTEQLINYTMDKYFG